MDDRRRNALLRGQSTEQDVRAYLESRGLGFIDANWRSRRGELDLIMEHDGVTVFVEVRLRGTGAWCDGAASITPRKQRRVVAAAQAWLQRHGPDRPCRIDVVSVDAHGTPDWIVNAFGA